MSIKFIFISDESEKDDNVDTNYYILVKDNENVEILGKTDDDKDSLIEKGKLDEFFSIFKKIGSFGVNFTNNNKNTLDNAIKNIDEKYKLTFFGIMYYFIKIIFIPKKKYYSFNINANSFTLIVNEEKYTYRSSSIIVLKYNELNKYNFNLHFIWYFLSNYYNNNQLTFYIMTTDKDIETISNIFKDFFNIYYDNSKNRYYLSLFDEEESNNYLKSEICLGFFIDDYFFYKDVIVINKDK